MAIPLPNSGDGFAWQVSKTSRKTLKPSKALYYLDEKELLRMAGEVYQAQVLKNFFDTITGTDRNLTRISMCVITLAKLRSEDPAQVTFLMDQMRKSREKKELSVDILDYMVDAAAALDLEIVQTAFGVTNIRQVADEFGSVSLDSF